MVIRFSNRNTLEVLKVNFVDIPYFIRSNFEFIPNVISYI